MNKYKKIAMAAVSVVMAGTMMASVSGCFGSNPDKKPEGPTFGTFGGLTNGQTYINESAAEVVKYLNTQGMSNFATTMNNAWQKLKNFSGNMNPTGGQPQAKLTVAESYAQDKSIKLNMNVCDGDNAARQIAYTSGQISGNVQMLDGVTYAAESVKPAWRAIGEELKIDFKNVATKLSSDKQINDNMTSLKDFDIITGSGDAIVTQAQSNKSAFLDLNQYLEYMPNYKAFLEANPVTRLSLTSDVTTGAMYYAPYYDGNDDIEKYELVNKIFVRDLLDATEVKASTDTFKSHAAAKNGTASATNGYTVGSVTEGTKASIEAFMGSTDWEIEATNPAKTDETITIYVKYSKAKAAAADEATDLGKAYKEAAGEAYAGTSGNIIDIMNAIINKTQGEVTGDKLLKVLRAYIDVAYTSDSAGETKAYTKRSDVFNGENAAWDVDLLAAFSRCLATNNGMLSGDHASMAGLYAIAGRANTTQRSNDLVSLAGELYGVRGLTPRYQFAYIDKDGKLVDARTQTDAFDAMEKMHAFVKEGLLYLNDNINGTPSVFKDGKAQTFMMFDYVQTQTKEGFKKDKTQYDFAPIITPVSTWNDGTGAKKMRFTESWRSVKNTGFCVPYDSVKDNPAKLKAILTLIDYMFSNDGQIAVTFGSQASGKMAKDGWWWATEATGVNLNDVSDEITGSTQRTVKEAYKGQYFIYKNKVYTGTSYKGTQIPTLTDDTLKLFKGEEVTTANGSKLQLSKGNIEKIDKVATNYTDFARGILGAALPLGNKNQGFEFQCTAQCGLDGAAIVSNALANGVIKHTQVTIEEGKLWYLLVPTTLPYTTAEATNIKQQYSNIQNGLFGNGSKIYRNVWLDIMYFGLGYNKK